MTATIEQVLQAIKQAHAERLAERRGYIQAVRDALSSYEKAVDADVLADFARRNGVESAGAPQAEQAAFALFESVEKLPELRGGALVEAERARDTVPEEEEEEAEETLASPDTLPKFPRLSAAAAERPLYLIGGVPVEAKIEWIRQLGIKCEWIGAKDNDSSIGKIVNRIRGGNVCAAVALNELMGHGQTGPVAQAAKAAGVLYMVGRKGGQGQLLAVFDELETRLTGLRVAK